MDCVRIGFHLYLVNDNPDYLHWQRDEDYSTFHVLNDDEVLYSSNCSEAVISQFLENEVLAIILKKRGYFLLHASAVIVDKAAVVICGESGSGKSSLAALLALKGANVLADDLFVLEQTPEGHSSIMPISRKLRVDQSFISMNNVPLENLGPFDEYSGKRRLSILEHRSSSLCYDKIVIIELENNTNSQVSMSHLRGHQALKSVFYHCPLPSLTLNEDDKIKRSRDVLSLLSYCSVYRLNRFNLTNDILINRVNACINNY